MRKANFSQIILQCGNSAFTPRELEMLNRLSDPVARDVAGTVIPYIKSKGKLEKKTGRIFITNELWEEGCNLFINSVSERYVYTLSISKLAALLEQFRAILEALFSRIQNKARSRSQRKRKVKGKGSAFLNLNECVPAAV